MTPCNVHVGFHHNVMSLPIAGLRYWRELGLQPVGGPKNVKAFVMFDERTGLGSLAREFLVRMSRAYQVCFLLFSNVAELKGYRKPDMGHIWPLDWLAVRLCLLLFRL